MVGPSSALRRRLLLRVLPAVLALAAAVAIAVPVVRHSDAATTVSVQASSAPRPLPRAPLPAVLRVRWSAPPAPPAVSAPPTPGAESGTVVLADSTGVSGRDPLTGAVRWSYHRGNAKLCGWVVQDGVVVVAFGKRAGCRDITGLDAGTGARRWYRNADLGPAVQLTGTASVVVARSGDQLVAVDTATGLNRWTARKAGCRYGPVTVGQLGAVAVVTCGAQNLLVSHDPYADSQRWSVPAPGADPVVVAMTDQEVAVLAGDRDRTLTRYNGSGHRLGALTDPRLTGPAGSDWPSGVTAGGLTVYWTGQRVVALDLSAGTVRWAVRADGPPTPDGGRLLFAAAGGFVECSPGTGRMLRRIPVDGSAPRAGARIARIGALLVAASPVGTAVLG